MNHGPTEESFLKDVATHEMTVIRDDGVNRHVQFKRPGTRCYQFNLITWPGYLCYCGDMGTYVFSRLDDMFQFFRTSENDWNFKKDGLSTNPGYWSEKIMATDKDGGHKEFDQERFIERVKKWRLDWIRDMKEEGFSKDDRRELWEEIEQDVLSYSDDGEHALSARVYEFSHRIGKRRFSFDDFFDGRGTRPTYHYLWCCFALAWGVQQYDKSKPVLAGQ